MEDRLVRELQIVLDACRQHGVEVFVIGGFGVRAYGSLLRRTFDLDLAVELKNWPALAEVLEAHGYRLAPAGIWATAAKGEGAEAVEIHIALDNVTDVQSTLSYPVHVESGAQQPPSGLDVALPVFTLEGLLITKLIALRDNDVVDVVALLSRHAARVSAERFWKHAIAAGLGAPLRDRLAEIRKMMQSGEVDAIWWDRLGLMLDDVERQATLKVIRHLQRRALVRR